MNIAIYKLNIMDKFFKQSHEHYTKIIMAQINNRPQNEITEIIHKIDDNYQLLSFLLFSNKDASNISLYILQKYLDKIEKIIQYVDYGDVIYIDNEDIFTMPDKYNYYIIQIMINDFEFDKLKYYSRTIEQNTIFDNVIIRLFCLRKFEDIQKRMHSSNISYIFIQSLLSIYNALFQEFIITWNKYQYKVRFYMYISSIKIKCSHEKKIFSISGIQHNIKFSDIIDSHYNDYEFVSNICYRQMEQLFLIQKIELPFTDQKLDKSFYISELLYN